MLKQISTTVVPATAGPLVWVNGHLLWPATFAMYYFAMLKYLHPTATCLTRPADSRMLDYIPAKEANRHGSFQICGDYYDISWSKVQHLCVFTCTHYTVNKCCWFFHTFQHCSFHLSLYTALLTDVLYNVNLCIWHNGAYVHSLSRGATCHEGPLFLWTSGGQPWQVQ